MSGRNPKKVDLNQNHIGDWQTQHGYTLVTRRLLVPNNLLATLDEAAYDSGFRPVPQRQPKVPILLDETVYNAGVRPVPQRQPKGNVGVSPVPQRQPKGNVGVRPVPQRQPKVPILMDEVTYDRGVRPAPQRLPKVPVRVETVRPLVNPDVGHHVSMAERRQLRLLNSKHTSVNEKCTPQPQDVHGDGKNFESANNSTLGIKEITQQVAQIKVNEKSTPKPQVVHGDGRNIESTTKSTLEIKEVPKQVAQIKERVEPQRPPRATGTTVRSPLDDQNKVSMVGLSNRCCCLRPQRVVHCRICGFRTKGNIRMDCPEHQQHFGLYELEVCLNPLCKAPGHLIESDD